MQLIQKKNQGRVSPVAFNAEQKCQTRQLFHKNYIVKVNIWSETQNPQQKLKHKAQCNENWDEVHGLNGMWWTSL